MYLDDGLRRYVYWIVVSNSKRSNEQVLRIAQGRGNQENLIKDFKYGLGLAHIPTGSPDFRTSHTAEILRLVEWTSGMAR